MDQHNNHSEASLRSFKLVFSSTEGTLLVVASLIDLSNKFDFDDLGS